MVPQGKHTSWQNSYSFLFSHFTVDHMVTQIEELAHLQDPCKGYRSHMARIFNKIYDTIGKDINKFSSTYLRTAIEQLQKKKELIHQIDLWIKELIQMSEELEDVAEELQDSIIEKISELQMHIEWKTLELTSKSLPSVWHWV